MLIDTTVGPKVVTDGGAVLGSRADRTGASVVTDGHGHWQEAAIRGKLFTAFLLQGTTTVAAGNIVGAAAAASTQFAVWNPASSGVNMVLQKLFVQITSGTPTAGGLIHSTFNAAAVANTLGTAAAVRNNLAYGPVGAGLCLASAAGAALTGGLILTSFRCAVFSSSATAQASPAGITGTFENIDGDIVLPPGVGYVPTWTGAGTTFLVGYSLTWEEVPV